MEDTGSGDAVLAEHDKADTVASSPSSTLPARRRTGKTVKLTLAQALEIVQQSLLEYQRAGGVLAMRNLPAQGMLAVVLANVWHCQHCGNLSAGSACQYCQDDNSSRSMANGKAQN